MQKRDWSVAALLPAADGALVLSVFLYFLSLAAAIYRISARSTGLMIVPDLRNPLGRRAFDPRRGFEVFRRLFRHSMIVALLSFVALFLENVQNTYIRLTDAHLLDYVMPDLIFPNGVLQELVAGGGRATFANLDGALSVAIGGLLFAMIVFGLAITLRLGAWQAHDLMQEQL